MDQEYAFHETVRGHLHVLNEMPCEDSSISFSAEDGKYNIAIVADGHGSKSCYRSEVGSKAATDVARKCLKELAEVTLESKAAEDRFYKDMFSNPRYRKVTIRQLTDTIIARWHDWVVEHYENNPPTPEEISESTENDNTIAHIYGTTLIAALKLPKCLILIQQGDGRCDVFYGDGSVDQPIPWDARCEDTTTTSLCDEDAKDSFRSYVIDLVDKPVMACYLGSDGIEDAYRDTYEELGGSHILMGGVHAFYKDLTCQLAAMGRIKFKNYLKTMLPKFSRSGSGDDISVAGIVDIGVIRKFVVQFQYDVKLYDLEEALYWKEDELRSKTRKHGILQKRVEEIQSELSAEEIKQLSLETELQQLKQEIKIKEEMQNLETEKIQEMKINLAKAQVDFEEYDSKYQAIEAERIRIKNEIDALPKKDEATIGGNVHEGHEGRIECECS